MSYQRRSDETLCQLYGVSLNPNESRSHKEQDAPQDESDYEIQFPGGIHMLLKIDN